MSAAREDISSPTALHQQEGPPGDQHWGAVGILAGWGDVPG